MEKQDFMKVFFNEFKEIGADIYRSAVKRRSKFNDASEKAIKYCRRKGTLLN